MAQKTTTLNIRISPELKRAAESLYESFGITITDAVNMFLSKSLMDNGLPFKLVQPRYNAETEAAIAEGRQLVRDMKEGKAKGFDNAEDMFKALNA